MCTCPKCGFDLDLEPLLEVRIVPEGVDPVTSPRHVAGYYSDLEQLRESGHVVRLDNGWWVPTDKMPDYVERA